MRRHEALLAPALEWLARLPLCGDRELGGLLGIDERDARRLIHELTRRGWLDSIEPGSPELDRRRRAFVREEALVGLDAASDAPPDDLVRRWPVRRRDVLERATRVEITAGVNRLLAELAATVTNRGLAELADARSLPLAAAPPDRWWLPGVHGYGCLRAGSLHAPFLIAWDRAAAPEIHRRRRVAAWVAASAAATRCWGGQGLPPLLVVCPSSRERRVWEDTLSRHEEHDARRFDVLLTTQNELSARGSAGPVWARPGRHESELLVELLGWSAAPPLPSCRLPESLDAAPVPPRREKRVRSWATAHVATPSELRRWERLAVLALATDPAEKTLLEWVARHPLLSPTELAELLVEPVGAIERRLEWLTRCGAIQADGGSKVDQTNAARYLATELCVRLLARRSDVPFSTFARRGGVTFVSADGADAVRAIHHRDHTIGVNRCFAGLAADAKRAGWRLAEWRNEAESTGRFVRYDGRASWIRPDGSGVLLRDTERCAFFVEYDRGTLDGGDYGPKLRAYEQYYGERRWEDDFRSPPLLLFICSERRSEDRVARAARSVAPDLFMAITCESRSATAPTGLLGSVWRNQHEDGRRYAVLAPDESDSRGQA